VIATAVLFDLDGTLVDTAPDLVDAVNRTRAALDLAPVPEPQCGPHVSRGGMADAARRHPGSGSSPTRRC
jgi:phosphoglycolate phosphatase